MMSDYINRDVLIDNLQRFVPDCYSVAVNNVIMAMPRANVKEVVTAHWIEYPHAHYFKCSKCKGIVPYKKAMLINGKREYEYCPHCGAEMSEVAE